MDALSAKPDEPRVRALRREIYAKGSVSREDLENLLDLARKVAPALASEYGALLADVAADLLLNQVDPPKYITQNDADWFVAQIRSAGGLSCRAEYEMLLAVLRLAVSIPASLAAFAVDEIERTIIQGHQAGGTVDHAAGIVTKEDLDALRSAVFAAVEGSSLHVTRRSAEALFRIAHATQSAANDPAFDDFFAKAVSNSLTGVSFQWTPTVAEERAKEQWLDEKPPSFARFLGGIIHIGRTPEEIAYQAEAARVAAENDADRAEIERKKDISVEDGDWVLSHLTRESGLTSAEKRLLSFLRTDARSLPPALMKRVEAEFAKRNQL